MAEQRLVGEVADAIYAKIQAFANFGFAESHSLSFGLLVYASSWIKLHYPAAFLAGAAARPADGLLLAATLTADARRHGVEVRRPDLLRSGVRCGARRPVGDAPARAADRADRARRLRRPQPAARRPVRPRAPPTSSAEHRRDGAFAVRLGLADVTRHRHDRRRAHRRRARGARAVPRHGATSSRRAGLNAGAARGARRGGRVRRASGSAGARRSGSPATAAEDREEFLAGSIVVVQPPLFADPTELDERLACDLWATGISTDDHPIRHYPRPGSTSAVRSASTELRTPRRGRRIEVGGAGHAPAAAGDGIRHHLHEPRGRARHAQRDLRASGCGTGTAGSCARRRR